jgi:plastocyanin
MERTFAMRIFTWTYWALAVTVAYVLLSIILPAAKESPEAASFIPLFVVFLVVDIIGAAVATFVKSAPTRPWLWLALLFPPVLFWLMNAPFLPYPLTHPADLAFTAVLPLTVLTIALVVLGITSFREARNPARGSRSGPRAGLTVALVAGLTLGATATGYLAATAAGGGGSALAATPTTSAALLAENTKYATTTYSMKSSDVLGLFVQNKDSFAHTFDIDSLNVHVQIPANSTVAVAIKPTAAGALEFYCAIPGHKAAGMDGTITVQ